MSSGEGRLSTAFVECPASLIRNVCIIAHVDHGKTTLADYLVSTNGIISARLAGKLRYMDSREDEQERGITMKSSAISLYYEPLLLNLIDSPGHVDFCTEVSSAVNLADIAVLLVDAVEGVCSQTESLVRQALAKKLDIILVLNKIDRLIIELKMSEAEAHQHIQRIIEFVNACLSKAIQGQLLEEDWKTFDQIESRMHFDPAKGNVLFASALYGYAFAVEDFAELWAKKLVAQQTWQPRNQKNTGVKEEIAEFKGQLMRHLFSRNHFFSFKTNEICAGAEQKDKKSMFEEFVLEPLWKVHKCALLEKNLDKIFEFTKKLALPQLKGRRTDEAFPELMRNWLPLSTAIVRACARGTSAQQAYNQQENESREGRLRELFHSDEIVGTLVEKKPLPQTADSLRKCDPNDSLVLCFVAKAFSATDQHQRQRRVSLCRIMSGTLRKGNQIFVLKASTSNTKGIERQKHRDINEFVDDASWCQVTMTALFMLLGRDLLEVEHISCGRICGVEVDGGEWIGGSLLSSRPLKPKETPSLERVEQSGKFADPIVRVTIKPAIPGQAEFAELRAALKQLAVLDSAVRIVEQKENEFLMLTAGEVHLQKCLEDLKALGQTELVVSEPIVPFLETLVVRDQRLSHAKILTDHLTECFLPQFSIRIRLRAVPLTSQEPGTDALFEMLKHNEQLIDSFREGIFDAHHRSKIDAFRSELAECASECLPKLRGSWWAKRRRDQIKSLFADNILSFGPSKAKLNILFNSGALPNRFEKKEDMKTNEEFNADVDEKQRDGTTISVWEANLRLLEQAFVGGFHIAMAQGPLCDESMQAVGIVLEGWILEEKKEDVGNNEKELLEDAEEEAENKVEKELVREEVHDERAIGEEGTSTTRAIGEEVEEENKCGPGTDGGKKQEIIARKLTLQERYLQLNTNSQLHGQLISAIRQACKVALKKHVGALRLLAAMYCCRVQTPEQVLGKVQAVLSQKRAKVYSEEFNEVSGFFEIVANLPVIESFSFCDQLRKRSSGKASAQLELTGWQLIDEDPFWEPSTEEEMEEFGRPGTTQQTQNQARQYMDAVRRRKGLPTEDVLVVSAEKQRNLKRNK